MNIDIPIWEIMTTDLVTLNPNDTIEKVDSIFNENDFRHLPVIDQDGKLIGMLSKSDYLYLCHNLTLFRKDIERSKNVDFFQSLLVGDVMSKQVATLQPDDKTILAAGLFKENLFHAIPIVEEGDKLVGMVTTIDLINYAYQQPELVSINRH